MKKEKQRGALLICFRCKYKTVYFINQNSVTKKSISKENFQISCIIKNNS